MKKNKALLLSGPYILFMVLFTLIPLGVVAYYAFTDPATGAFTWDFCLLFSLDVIDEPFLRLASRWWPIVLIAAGICLIVLFFVWNTHKIQLEDVEDDFNDLDDIS